MSDSTSTKGAHFLRDLMRVATVIGILMAVISWAVGLWIVAFGDVPRIGAGSACVAIGMGLFSASIVGHGVQLWTER